MCVLSYLQLFATQWIVACQAPLSIGFYRREYWDGLPFPSPGDLADPGIEPMSLMFPAVAGMFFATESESEVTQLGPILCAPMDCSLRGSSVYGIFQARILEWVAICFSRRSSQPRD